MNRGAPPASALTWACAALGARTWREIEPASGSSGAGVWLLRTAAPEQTAVLKLSAQAGKGFDERLIGREATVLEALAPFGLPAPRLLAVDGTGEHAGAPALLMTREPGSLLASPDAVREAIPAMAEALTRCQSQAHNLIAGRRWTPWLPPEGLLVPSWSTREALWSRAIRVVQRFQPPPRDAFIHRDPHPSNLLFEHGKVSAILDWAHAGRGPAGFDGARMAMNLCCLLGMDAATAFRSAFEQALGRRHDPLLDVFAACEFLPDPAIDGSAAALGIELNRNQARGRLENFLADAMRRMTSRRLS